VTTQRILTFESRPWRSDPDAQVLLLGDSFANIYSVDRLGWGAGAGLAEQLSYYLQQPVDKIALDAGGSHASRQALARELEAGNDRLAGKKVLVYQFAVRELAFGDWKLIPPLRKKRHGSAAVSPLRCRPRAATAAAWGRGFSTRLR
jgi:alginate O-acetyltransferase complex protein AlgJ